MSETPIRFGILGCAEIARKVSRAILLAPNASLVAIGSRSVEKARQFAADNSFPSSTKIYGSYGAVLEDTDVDAVYIPLPTSLHLQWVVAAARKKKHILLEKPVAVSVSDLDKMLSACESSGVQFMDGTMWMHHPRTQKMKHFISSDPLFGRLNEIHSTFSYSVSPEFLKNDIRVQPDLDSLGALGDTGWYCIRAILWATNYELPRTVAALKGTVFNDAGVIISSGASMYWEDGKVATFHCSFLSNHTMDIAVLGTQGALHVHDFVIPFTENEASFYAASNSGFTELVTGWAPLPSHHAVVTDLPQEALMVEEFSNLVGGIKEKGSKPEMNWAIISRKTQLVLDAVKESIDKGCVTIEVLN